LAIFRLRFLRQPSRFNPPIGVANRGRAAGPPKPIRDYTDQIARANGEFEYRVKSVNEPYERVVRQSDLSDVL